MAWNTGRRWGQAALLPGDEAAIGLVFLRLRRHRHLAAQPGLALPRPDPEPRARDPQAVVPFGLALEPSEHTLLVSGPNTGGKTVLLKAVALLALVTLVIKNVVEWRAAGSQRGGMG